MIQLDSDVVIALLNRSGELVRARFDGARTDGESIALPTVVFHELMFGAAGSRNRERNEAKIALLISQDIAILPFEEAGARHAADIRADLRRLGTPIGPYDVFIAAQARRRDATLATANGREFKTRAGVAGDGLGDVKRSAAVPPLPPLRERGRRRLVRSDPSSGPSGHLLPQGGEG